MNEHKNVLLLTEKGILTIDGEPLPGAPFTNQPVDAGDRRDGHIAVIVNDKDVWTCTANEWKLQATSELEINCLLWVDGGGLLAGTAGARVAWVVDGGLEFIESFDALTSRKEWDTPWGGPPDIRSMTRSIDGTIYVNIHVGWIARSVDDGRTWTHHRKGLEKDVHQIVAHPVDSETVFASTATGFYISHDKAESFKSLNEGLPFTYLRSCASFVDKNILLASSSTGPHEVHRKMESFLCRKMQDEGCWESVKGLPEPLDKIIDTFHIVTSGGARAFVVVNQNTVYTSDDWGARWHTQGTYDTRIFALLLE